MKSNIEPSEYKTEKFFQIINEWMINANKMEQMSDEELSDAAMNQLGLDLDMYSEESCLLDELRNRFDKKCGIVRDKESGEIIS